MSPSMMRRRPYRSAAAFLLLVAVVCALTAAGFQATVLRQARLIPAVTDHFRSSYTGTAEVVFDGAAFAAGMPAVNRAGCTGAVPRLNCFTVATVPVTGEQTIDTAADTGAGADPDNRVRIVGRLQATAGTVPLWSITTRQLVDRATAVAVDDSTVATTGGQAAGVAGGRKTISGEALTFWFPPSTPKRSYRYFDPLTLSTHPLDFADPVPAETTKNLAFRQLTGPEDISAADTATSALTVDAATAYTPVELAANGLNAGTRVELHRYRFVHRVLVVHPDSGFILDETLAVRDEFARTPGEATAQAFGGAGPSEPEVFTAAGPRTALWATLSFDKPSTTDTFARAGEFRADLTAATGLFLTLGAVSGLCVLGAALLTAGAARRRIRAAGV